MAVRKPFHLNVPTGIELHFALRCNFSSSSSSEGAANAACAAAIHLLSLPTDTPDSTVYPVYDAANCRITALRPLSVRRSTVTSLQPRPALTNS
jgi:Asp-tRNA(Asn)/Glu-tRNA(Gln) amidotransferase A subunit family amidase